MTELDALPTTSSGLIPKRHVIQWMSEVADTEPDRLIEAFVPKPKGFTGSKYPTPISDLLVTGDPTYIEVVAGLVKPVLCLENEATRLDLKLKQIPDRETDQLTDNYALYLSVAERDGNERL